MDKDNEIILTIVNTRSEFNNLIKTIFIPYLIKEQRSYDIDLFKKLGMFQDWTLFFYYENNKSYTYELRE